MASLDAGHARSVATLVVDIGVDRPMSFRNRSRAFSDEGNIQAMISKLPFRVRACLVFAAELGETLRRSFEA
jgi:hypothetical protein